VIADELQQIDLTDPARFEQDGYPWGAWDLLRRVAPVYWYERPCFAPFWAITRYADLVAISKDSERFANWPRPMIRAEHHDQSKECIRGAQALAPDLLEMDPPKHTRHRRTVNRFFTPQAVQRLAPTIDHIVGDVISGMVARLDGEFDLAADLAGRIPIAVICRMLGVADDDVPAILVWVNEWVAPADPAYQRGRALAHTLEDATRALYEYFRVLIAQRRADPRDDLVSHLLRTEIDGQPASEAELLSMCVLLLVSGHETTRNAITGGVLALLDHPDQWARLRSDDTLLDPAVEEILRWTSPIIHFARTAIVDVEIAGQRIRRGDTLALFYPSANRDERVFADPYRFDLGRRPNPHVAFGGFGDHHCLGAPLARAEIRMTLCQLLRRFPALTVAVAPERVRSAFVSGIKRLVVRPSAG
jgi:cholest-4-en-3-one 26-monooxygenase